MKRVWSFLLTAAMLLAMLAEFTVSIGADEAEIVPTMTKHADYKIPTSGEGGSYVIQTSRVSANQTSGTIGTNIEGKWVNNIDGTMDWSKLPLSGFFPFVGVPAQIITSTGENDRFRVIGKFAAPTTVASFAVKTVKYNTRCSNLTVSFSEDGKTWTDILTTKNNWPNNKFDPVLTYTIPEQYANVTYRYVKIEQKTDSSTYTALGGFVFYTNKPGTATNAPTRTDLAKYEMPSDACVIPASVDSSMSNKTFGEIGFDSAGNWIGKDGVLDWSQLPLQGFLDSWASQKIRSDSEHKNDLKIVGKFASPTTVSSFALKTRAATRLENVSIAFSKDGQAWDVAAVITFTSWQDAGEYVITYSIPETYANEQYSYVKIEREGVPPESTNVLTMVGGFVFFTKSGSMFTGTQDKKDTAANTYSVRFVSTVDASATANYSRVGYEIAMSGEGIPAGSWDKSTNKVYTSIIQTVNGQPETLPAPDGRYYFALTVENISMDYGDITFTIKPYVLLTDGVTKIYAPEVVIVYNDGALVTPEGGTGK